MPRRALPRPARPRLAAAGLAVIALAATLLVDAPRAQAATYPSWDDVLAARGQEDAKRDAIAELRDVIDGLADDADAAAAEAQRLGSAFEQAQLAATRAAEKEQRLRTEAEEHEGTARESAAQAGRYAAQLSRAGGADVTASILADGTRARDLLYDLGAMSKLAEQAERIGATATNDAAVARSVTAQADRAAERLTELADEAADRMAVAQRASDAAQVALDEQRSNDARLQAQLATLESGRVRTEQEFAKGERERKAREERLAREAAERMAAAQRRAQAAQAAGGPAAPAPAPAGGGAAGTGAGTGWVRPAGGPVVSPYGWRVHPIYGTGRFHDGLDLASGCSTAIVAAAAGRVSYAGWFGGYGNYVKIDHGGGVSTAYGHIVAGGFRVASGQQVQAGQLIALVGSTGASTGCHTHYEVHLNGATTDPAAFMRARGVGM